MTVDISRSRDRAEWLPSGQNDKVLQMLCSSSCAMKETLRKLSSLLDQNTRALVIKLLKSTVQLKL